MEINILESLISGAGGGGAAMALAILLLRKTLADLSERIDRTDEALREYRTHCNSKMENSEKEFRQIITSLHEIKIQITKGEALSEARNELARDIAIELASLRCRNDDSN